MRLKELAAQAAQAFFFPQACALCGRPTCNPDFSPLCRGCRVRMEPLRGPVCDCCGIPLPGNIDHLENFCSACRHTPPPFACARAWGLYEGQLRQAIHCFKFEGFRRLFRPLAALLVEACGQLPEPDTIDWILPVPLHRKRRRRRGFDQAALLAGRLSRMRGIPLFYGLRRVRETTPQFGLAIEDRRRNLRGAFQLRGATALAGDRILIVDDILTTGSTVAEIVRVLNRAGEAGRIDVLTLARVARWRY